MSLWKTDSKYPDWDSFAITASKQLAYRYAKENHCQAWDFKKFTCNRLHLQADWICTSKAPTVQNTTYQSGSHLPRESNFRLIYFHQTSKITKISNCFFASLFLFFPIFPWPKQEFSHFSPTCQNCICQTFFQMMATPNFGGCHRLEKGLSSHQTFSKRWPPLQFWKRSDKPISIIFISNGPYII